MGWSRPSGSTGIVAASNIETAQGLLDSVGVTPASLFSTLVKSHAANGYQKLPNGLIIQWGSASFKTTGQAVTFPNAFPNACVALCFGAYSGLNSLPYALAAPSTTGFTGYTGQTNTNAFYIAVGY